jgi:hypothetical protein
MCTFDELVAEKEEMAKHPERNIENITREMTELSQRYGVWVAASGDNTYLAKIGSSEPIAGGKNADGIFAWDGDHYEAKLNADWEALRKRDMDEAKSRMIKRITGKDS